jgi:hypothetical protein
MRTLLFLALVALLVGASVVPNATSRSMGITSELGDTVAANGCSCHGSNASSGLFALSLDTPANFTANETYILTITMESTVPADGENQGGFYLSVTQGSLASVDNSTQLIDRYLTHTTMGNDQRNWNFSWTAPDDDTRIADFMLYGSAVNGNGAPDSDGSDQWNRATFAVPGSGVTKETKGTLENSLLTLLLVSALTAVAVIALFRPRKR